MLEKAYASKQYVLSYLRIPTLFDAALFQFINPKAWAEATATASIFISAGTPILASGFATANVQLACAVQTVTEAFQWAERQLGADKFGRSDIRRFASVCCASWAQ